jgi:hypothetical protein
MEGATPSDDPTIELPINNSFNPEASPVNHLNINFEEDEEDDSDNPDWNDDLGNEDSEPKKERIDWFKTDTPLTRYLKNVMTTVKAALSTKNAPSSGSQSAMLLQVSFLF